MSFLLVSGSMIILLRGKDMILSPARQIHSQSQLVLLRAAKHLISSCQDQRGQPHCSRRQACKSPAKPKMAGTTW